MVVQAVLTPYLLKEGLSPDLNFLNVTQSTNLSSFINHPTIWGVSAFNLSVSAELSKRDSEMSILPSLLFHTDLGTHHAVGLHLDHSALISKILDAIPGQLPEQYLAKRDDGFEVDWVSYNYDNVNKDLAVQWTQDPEALGQEEISYAFETFVEANTGWKWCIDATIDDVPSEPMDNNHYQNLETAIHGEIYLNTYGGIDSQCNEAYDCEDGKCDGV
ncbi:hypothetical protein KAFR_0B03250 [Kazachstania africana CBS 2517]|uniref:Uncharacterized protein n=1 Tax=Kazachstania africana (strain ATCC 22294 / BCRC 22015 / CBS 2517 / CECT 1963 / NBRC 1671 / NRRL Y-8276) TaxID=1071382 RepID=H2AQH1_KAZAF|nr:hypothetical protein KAFR_0B03250 [Kazachstania africana CBS 2517]CCF56621.1 hypothetical protein KAFR_0B03250 [Kazachstania africana CBS 2517]